MYFSCAREICRQTLKGCLRIPGCKPLCYNCLLRPYACCLGESDEEKDDKDDEGYDSYGITASQNHLPDHQQLTTSRNNMPEQQQVSVENNLLQNNFNSHEYVNESEICPIEYKLNVSLKDNEQTNVAAHSVLQYADILDTSTCNNNKHQYVNESVLFSKLASEQEKDSSLNSQINGDSPSLNSSNDFKTDSINAGCNSIHRQNSHQTNDSFVMKAYETRSLESKVADVVSSQQTLILLETDV